MNFDIEFIR